MSLIKSISGIRGTIGGKPGVNFTPVDIVKFTAAYGSWLLEKGKGKKVVVGRDGRMSGSMVNHLVVNTLLGLGIDVLDAGLSTTPTVEMAVVWEQADGGIIITASHNPMQWNALKLLNNHGEFISAEDGLNILEKAANERFEFANVNTLGKSFQINGLIDKHVESILKLNYVDKAAIGKKQFKVVVDVINSTGAIAIPQLLESLGVENAIIINSEITGNFAHNPEPLPEHLTQLYEAVKLHNADFGISVDPDVDRLCFVCEDGTFFGEEYTLVAVANYVLQLKKGSTVSNLSSSRALRDVTREHGCNYYAAAVGEVNVVKKMKEVNAVIGGEGNGGIILPELHYGRDALVGVALFLSALAKFEGTISAFRKTFPDYHMAKKKVDLAADVQITDILAKVRSAYADEKINTEDGLKIDLEEGWIHLRASNTEPIIRIYTEATTKETAEQFANDVMNIF
ncbi:phosphoglucosamine mutase [Pinibacter aurantiacus]|uniref:Phosphoglucosamine mutase n=1 Tax=Pinibacter aurantiacus TaxID=2851599 RepID=A0A9E2SB69_9BACT|nr:phosphoglucosamine mutase [Pinibacter aurantiacus]MBV4358243.1 phosphoglucosamine mutase [Pinibacter aurantiacus]